jgi:AraC-like DNA-binding protein
MEQMAFDEWVRWPIVRHFEKAFRKATGVAVHVVAVERNRALPGNRTVCPQEPTCGAGLTQIRVPVLIGGRHVATLVTDQVFRSPRSRRDFLTTLNKAEKAPHNGWNRQARRDWLKTPVIPLNRLEAVAHLLNVFASYLDNDPNCRAIFAADRKPGIVSGAKQFIQARMHERVTLQLVAQHVHVSRFYFCKVFKKATGMTLTDYVARSRVDKVKALLADPSVRVSEAGYAAGFGSIPRFNSAFKQYAGMAPSKYRAALRSSPPSFPNRTIANKQKPNGK